MRTIEGGGQSKDAPAVRLGVEGDRPFENAGRGFKIKFFPNEGTEGNVYCRAIFYLFHGPRLIGQPQDILGGVRGIVFLEARRKMWLVLSWDDLIQ
jgi:hypothetical protein